MVCPVKDFSTRKVLVAASSSGILPADGPGDLASLGDLEQRLNGVGIRLDSIEGVAIDDGERSLALCHFIDDRLGVQMLFYEDHL